MEHGCDPALPDDDGDMTIHIGCLFGQLIVVKYLITEQHCDPNCRGKYGSTSLNCACKRGHIDIIQYLITEHACDPALPNNDGVMPIHTACLSCSFTFASVIPSCSFTFARVIPTLGGSQKLKSMTPGRFFTLLLYPPTHASYYVM